MVRTHATVPGFFGLRRARPAVARRDFAGKRLLAGVRRPDLADLPGVLATYGERRAMAGAPAAGLAATPAAANGAAQEGAPAAALGAARMVSPMQRLVERSGLGATPSDFTRAAALGYSGYLEEQLAYESIDDSQLEAALAQNLPTLAMSPAKLYSFSDGNHEDVPIVELWMAAIYRSLYSPRQLLETMVVFWTDHFNIDLFGDTGFFLKPVDDREVIRKHALGSFPDLLWASAHSPAMLAYLSNDTNYADHPNQNYAREPMELHTLGADNGYSHKDVEEVSRCFTGWTYAQDGDGLGRFLFDASVHDSGGKTVLGHTIPAGGGIEDGEAVLRILAAHPNTAAFIAKKLLRYLWGYSPPRNLIDRVAKLYQNTRGDIRSMLRLILSRPFMRQATPKLKRPYHYMIAALRSTFARLDDPGFVLNELVDAGQLPFTWSPPNGYPDSQEYWSGFLLARWNFAASFIDEASGVHLELDQFLDPELRPSILAARIDSLLFDGTMTAATSAALLGFLRQAPPDRDRIRDALGLAIASPDFQLY